MDRQVFNLNAVVAKLEPRLRQLFGEEVGLDVNLDSGLGDVEAAPDRLELLILEFAARARDASALGGTLMLETRNLDVPGVLRGGAVRHGRFVVVSVRSASDPEGKTPALVHEADAEASTSELAEIVEALGGHVVFGVDTQGELNFEVYLPRIERELTNDTVFSDGIRFHETILLADDEDPVREFARIVLEKKGYRVLVARNGAEAIRVSTTHTGPIHLMLADVVMPELGGPEAARHLNRVRPEMRILFLSGYSNRVVSRHDDRAFGRDYLQKPFTMDSLSEKVRQVLDAESDPPTV